MTRLQFKTLYRNYRQAQKAYNSGNNDAIKVLMNQSNTVTYTRALRLVQGVYADARKGDTYTPETSDYLWFGFYHK